MSTTIDEIIAFQTGPPYHEWAILCIDCGAPGFDKELPRSEVREEKCAWCSADIENAYKWLVQKLEGQRRRNTPSEDEKHDMGVRDQHTANDRPHAYDYAWSWDDNDPQPVQD